MPDGGRQHLFGEGGGAQRSHKSSGVPLLGQVPLDPGLRVGGDEGRPISATDPDSEAARAFAGIAAALVALGRARVFRSEHTVH